MGQFADALIKSRNERGTRVDGTMKGDGWLGRLERPDGRVSTEISVGVEIDGKETLIPTLVPTLEQEEIDHLLNRKDEDPIPENILQKAAEHARGQLSQGLSPFKNTEAEDAQRRFAAGANVIEAADVNGDEYAELLRISREVGVPADLVASDVEGFKKELTRKKYSYSDALRANRALQKAMANPEFAKLAADDMDVLDRISQNMEKLAKDPAKQLGEIGKASLREVSGFGKQIVERVGLDSMAGLAQVPVVMGDSLVGMLDQVLGLVESPTMQPWKFYQKPEDRVRTMKPLGQALEEEFGVRFDDTYHFLHGLLSAGEQESLTNVEEAEGFVDTFVAYLQNPGAIRHEMLKSAGFLATGAFAAREAIAVGATKANALLAAHASEGMITSGLINQSLQREGVDPDRARKFAAMAGATTSFIGFASGQAAQKFGIGDAVEGLLIRSARAAATRKTLKEATGGFIQEGMVEEGLQNVSETIYENIAKGKPAFEGVGKAYSQGVAVGGPMGSTMNAISVMLDDMAYREQQARRSARQVEIMEALGDDVKASKLRERSSEEFKAFLDAVLEDGPVEDVRIPVERLDEMFQEDEEARQEIYQAIPGLQEQVLESRILGSDVVIPISDYTAAFAPLDIHNKLLKDIRFREDDLTANEYEEVQSKQAELLQEYVEEAGRKIAEQTDQDARLEAIFDQVKSMLIEVGESPLNAHQQATLWPAVMRVMEVEYGFDARDVFNEIGLKVKAPYGPRQQSKDNLDYFIDRVRKSRRPEAIEMYGQSLIQMLSSKGGVIDEGGVLSARDAQEWHKGRGGRKFVNPEGMSLDGAREIAIGEGYLPEDATLDDLLELIDTELGGEPVFAEQNRNETLIEQQAENDQLIEFLAKNNLDIVTATNEQIRNAINNIPQTTDPEQVYDQSGEMLTDTYPFEQWFGESAIVDDENTPLVVYRGSREGQQAFRLNKHTGIIYASTERSVAETFTLGSGRQVYEVYVSAQNPYDFREKSHVELVKSQIDEAVLLEQLADPDIADLGEDIRINGAEQVLEDFYIGLDEGVYTSVEIPHVIDIVRENGFDAVLSREYLQTEGYNVGVFDQAQMKSVYNYGAFDPTDPRIYYQDDPATLEGIEVEELTEDEAVKKTIEKYLSQTNPHGTGEGDADLKTLSGRQVREGFSRETYASDDTGQPLRLNRGSALALHPDHFNFESLGKASGYSPSGLGVWFSTDPEVAANYGNVQQFYLDIRNPYVYTFETLPEYDTLEEYHALRERLRAQGHDGVVMDHRMIGGGLDYVAFDAEQVIQIPEEYYQAEPEEVFFSALLRGAENIPQGKATPQQWLAMLSKQPGVKKAEIEWLGLEEWLAEQGKTVTREDVVGFIAENQVKVEEVEKEYRDPEAKEQLEEELNYEELKRYADAEGLYFDGRGVGEYMYLIDEEINETIHEGYPEDILRELNIELDYDEITAPTDPKFAEWQLPGGENYRELLLTLPEVKPVEYTEENVIWDEAGDDMAATNPELFWYFKVPDNYMQIPKSKYATAEEAKQYIISQKQPEISLKDNYVGPHYDEPNILAHVRFNERTDADGNRILFIEEVQSDWGQQLRKDRTNIQKAVDNDFDGIINRMKSAGVLTVEC